MEQLQPVQGHQQPLLLQPPLLAQQQPPLEHQQQQQQQQQHHAQQQQQKHAQQQPQQHENTPLPPCFIITHSVSKKHNVGTIIRCASAFNVKQVCLVGTKHYNSFGAHGSEAHVDFRHFHTLEECCSHLKRKEGCEVLGIEIAEGALPIHAHPFTGPTAFMLGNEGHGMTDRQMALCDRFVYISQYGAGTASLNVAVAASIVLHQFALWAGYPERGREGAKFVVDERPQRRQARGCVGADPTEVQAQRKQQQLSSPEAARAAEAEAGVMLAELLG